LPAHALAIANGEVTTLSAYDKSPIAAISLCHEHLKRHFVYEPKRGKDFYFKALIRNFYRTEALSCVIASAIERFLLQLKCSIRPLLRASLPENQGSLIGIHSNYRANDQFRDVLSWLDGLHRFRVVAVLAQRADLPVQVWASCLHKEAALRALDRVARQGQVSCKPECADQA
jgi:hypothetical protein